MSAASISVNAIKQKATILQRMIEDRDNTIAALRASLVAARDSLRAANALIARGDHK